MKFDPLSKMIFIFTALSIFIGIWFIANSTSSVLFWYNVIIHGTSIATFLSVSKMSWDRTVRERKHPYIGEVVKDRAGSEYVIIDIDYEDKSISIWRRNFSVNLLGYALRSPLQPLVSRFLDCKDRATVATVSNLYPLEADFGQD